MRKLVGRTLRFEILKRDGFSCKFCGRKPPEIVLEVDHLVPFIKGGENNYENLVAACSECNQGKRDKDLDACYLKKPSQIIGEIKDHGLDGWIKISVWAQKQGFTQQRAKQIFARINPKPVRHAISGWWMVDENAKIEKGARK